MAIKLEAARLATTAGGNVIIAGGRAPNVICRIMAGEPVGTLFLAAGRTRGGPQALDRLLREAPRPPLVGRQHREAVLRKGRSLLAIGVGVAVEGRFRKGDVVGVAGPRRGGIRPRVHASYRREGRFQKIKGTPHPTRLPPRWDIAPTTRCCIATIS